MLKELSEDLSNMKKIQSETKDTLIEIKNNFPWLVWPSGLSVSL